VTRAGLPRNSQRAGISFVQVYNIESGRTLNPRESTRLRITQALGEVPADEVVEATAEATAVAGLGSLEDFDPYADDQLPMDLRKKVEQILIRFLKSNALLNKHHVQREDG
jgi:transcriptional regulator with XRE-family HTH domain